MSAEEIQDDVWIINSEDRANWYIRKVANLAAEIERIKAQSGAMIRELQAETERLRWRHEADLIRYCQSILKPGKKSVKFLQGTAQFRDIGMGVKVVDEGAAMRHIEESGWREDCLKLDVDTEAYKKRAKAALQESGEVIPGIELVPGRETFQIRFEKEKED